MLVSIIIINYKSCQLVMDCLHSIVEQTPKGIYEIIVVDNNSNDGAEAIIKNVFPEVQWLQMGYNAGFARANNAGMRLANGSHFLILNADTIILNNAIVESLQLLEQYPDAVGCGIQLLNTDGTTQISGAHFIRGGLNTLLPLPYLGRIIRWLGYRLKTTIPSVQQVSINVEVDWVVGAYMLIKKQPALQSGLFDEDFFMYAEEIEWCARLRKLGKLVLFAKPSIIHIGGGTSGNFYNTNEQENGKNLWNKKGRQIIVSNMLRIRKQFGVAWFILLVGTYLLEIPIFAIGLLADKLLNFSKIKFTWQNVRDYTANMGVLLRFFPAMLVNKKGFYKTN
jgi:GT2 family glycosyltransferase